MPGKDELRFEMNQLLSYDDESLIEEIRRVAALLPGARLTRKSFDGLSRASSSTIVHRLGGWESALERAGLGDRYGGRRVTDKVRRQQGRLLTAEQIVAELRRLADEKGQPTITVDDVKRSDLLSIRVVTSRFGTWRAAIEAAGLELSSKGRRWTDEDYFENMLTVWTHYARPPKYGEMDKPPSQISSGGYEAKFGTWGRAKQAFVDWVNADKPVSRPAAPRTIAPSTASALAAEDQRKIPPGLRMKVFRRDNYRCVICGRSPAKDPACPELQVDHVVAFSRGGKTREDNLRVLCADCNVGKGAGD